LNDVGENRTAPGPSSVDDSARRNQSALDALVQLTTSERRVLFFLTQGLAAQEIADDLVVSLTTVRSHIRSVLRKLGVRSQLAAVAVANSQDLRHQDPTGDSPRETNNLSAPAPTGDSPVQ
jgi:DNA-binding NarL/FixJ family response regulator